MIAFGVPGRIHLGAALVCIVCFIVGLTGCARVTEGGPSSGSGGGPWTGAGTGGRITVAVDRGIGGSGQPPLPIPTSDILSLSLRPENPTITVDPSMPPATQMFTLEAKLKSGETKTVPGRWTIEDGALGTFGGDGLLTAKGPGGLTTVSVFYGSLPPVKTNVTFMLVSSAKDPSVTANDVTTFGGAPLAPDNGTAGPVVEYPLPSAVMPKSVVAPRIMWSLRTAAQANDLVRVTLSRPHAQFTWYGRSASGTGFAIPAAPWAAFAATDLGEPISLQVSTLSGTTMRTSEARTFKTIDANLGGVIYYWAVQSTRLERVDVPTGVSTAFLPNPGTGVTCIGCHSVSRDGQRLVGFLEGLTTDLVGYDLKQNLAANPAPNVGRQTYPSRYCGTTSPDGQRYLMGTCGRGFFQVSVDLPTELPVPFILADMTTMKPIASATGKAGTGFDPEWSPDGKSIAFTDTSERLVVESYAQGDVFGSPTVVHSPPATVQGGIDWHPTWTPDSAWLAFQIGKQVRWVGDGRQQTGDLYLISASPGGGNAVLLRNAAAGAPGQNFRPIFSPFSVGKYFWLLFTSTRSYGTQPAGGVEGQKQIWVAAIKNSPDGSDPSEAPYWLAGQSKQTALSPYWVPPAGCLDIDQSCAGAGTCCNGLSCSADTKKCVIVIE